MSRKRNYTNITGIIHEFMNEQIDTIRYIPAPSDYKNLTSALASFRHHIKANNLPIAVRKIDNRMYLIRTDRVKALPICCNNCKHYISDVCIDCDDFKFWEAIDNE